MPDHRMTLFQRLDERTPMTGRLAMGVEYDGSAYCGWQFLKHAPSVQASLKEALASIHGLDMTPTMVRPSPAPAGQ